MRAVPMSQPPQCLQRVVGDQTRDISNVAIRDDCHGAGGDRLCREIVSVDPLSLQSTEHVTRCDVPRIDRKSGCLNSRHLESSIDRRVHRRGEDIDRERLHSTPLPDSPS